MRNLTQPVPRRFILTVGMSLALAGASVSGAAVASAGASHPAAKSAVVVKERSVRHFGKILATFHGASLYYQPHGSCGGQCLSIWPRLIMPSGKTQPKGASCLGTATFGRHHKLQVTYRKHRLYTFTGDSGGSVNGNDVGGFVVAKVVRCR